MSSAIGLTILLTIFRSLLLEGESMCLKKMEPYKCEFVPVNSVVAFCLRHRTMMQMVHDGFERYLLSSDFRTPRWQRKQSHDDFYKSDLVKALKATQMLHFNYMDSTMATNSTVYRFVRIYRKQVLKINHWFK